MAAGALAESAPPQGANGSVYYAYDYGIYADGNDHGAALNALITAASLASGGGHIILPDTGFVRSSVPIVMQSGIWLQGAGGQVSGIQLTNNSACDVLNYQCYVPTATTWTASTVYAANAVVIAPGPAGASWYYYANQSIGAPVTAAPIGDFYNWTAFSPVPVAGTAPSATAQAQGCKLSDLQLNGNNTNQPNGDWHHAHNLAATVTDSTHIIDNVWARRATGDSFHTTGGSAAVNSNAVRYLNCYGATSAGTGMTISYDSEVTSCHFGYHGLGAMLFQRNSVRVASTKCYNNGFTPAFMAENTTGTGTASSLSTTVTVAGLSLTSDMIGQGIFDGAGSVPGQGSIPAGTYIVDVTSTTSLTLSTATTGAITAGTTLHIGGYYFQAPQGSGNVQGPSGCVGVADGVVYTLKVASVSGLGAGAAPAVGSPAGSGTTNFQPIRTAYEWGFDYVVQGSSAFEIEITGCTSQRSPRGNYGLQSTATSEGSAITGCSSSVWMENPRTTRGGLITLPQTVTNLLAPGMLSISSSSANIVSITASQHDAAPAPGPLVSWASGTSNNVTITSDANYASVLGSTQSVPIGGNVLTVNGVPWGVAGVPPETAYTGPAGGTSGLCLAQSVLRPLGNNAATGMTTGLIKAGSVYLPAGVSITKLGWITGTTPAASPTHQWLALFDSSYNMLCNTADQTTAAIAASTPYQYAVAATASGAAASYVTQYAGLYYIGIMETASVTVATALGASLNSVAINALTPVPSIVQVGSPLTTPPSYPYTITGATSSGLASIVYVWAS